MAEFNLDKARALRDAGMALVVDHNPTFEAQFKRFIDHLPRGWIGICEDIRQGWMGVQPASPHAWGACWNAAKKRGQLVELPTKVSMTGAKSHGRRTNLHRKAHDGP
jgi:hypothetical protein